MWIYLDDIREIPNGFIGARTYDEFVKLYNENDGNIERISLDHDLGNDKYSGYSICLWLVENDKFNGLKEIYIHSANAVGVKNMIQLLDRYAPKDINIFKVSLDKTYTKIYR